MATFRSLAELADFISALPITQGRRIIGIVGAPGAGKSTIAADLVARLASTALLPMDGYHLPQARLVELGRRDRMGAPDTFDVEQFLLTLRDLEMSGGPVFAPGFDRTIEEPVPDAIVIQPEIGTVVVEGNYLLLDSGGWERVAPLLDLSFFVELDDRIRLERLIERHVRFGKAPADARAWALGPDEANARIIAATADHADHRIRLK
ncbi:MAG: nucleoside/nucleotide kinase family protein [Rhodoglobus sp.]|nr:nucleoside/nucleotide kinase family protein [Rhodoglobus sp.]